MITSVEDMITLKNGARMPGMGFGCAEAHGDELIRAIHKALEVGYRYIDTASVYNNEHTIGEAIRLSPFPRDKIFLLSKIWPTDFAKADIALDNILRRLGTDYLDACLLHWPGTSLSLRLKAIELLMRAQEEGKIRLWGVSNFLVCHLRELYGELKIFPVIDQIQVHPFFSQKEVRAYCHDHDIQVISWSPLGLGMELPLSFLWRLSRQIGKSEARILLRWHLQKNLIPIPKSVTPARIEENARLFDFSLDDHQMLVLDSLDLPYNAARVGKDPMVFPNNG